MPTPKLTNAQYVEMDGNICPFCGQRSVVVSGNIKWNHDLNCFSQTATCDDCNTTWFNTHSDHHLDGFIFVD